MLLALTRARTSAALACKHIRVLTSSYHARKLCRWLAVLVLLSWYVVLNLLNMAALTFLPPPPMPPPAPPIQEEDYHLSRGPNASSRRSLPSARGSLPGLGGQQANAAAVPALAPLSEGGKDASAALPQSRTPTGAEGDDRLADGHEAANVGGDDAARADSSGEVAVHMPEGEVRAQPLAVCAKLRLYAACICIALPLAVSQCCITCSVAMCKTAGHQ